MSTRGSSASPRRSRTASPARSASPRRGRTSKSAAAAAAKEEVHAPVTATRPATRSPTKAHAKKEIHIEFGGPIGCAAIMILSHVLLYYVYFVLRLNNGNLWFPSSVADFQTAVAKTSAATTVTVEAFIVYGLFLLVEGIFAYYMPGLDVNGRPDETGRVLRYRCNAYLSWLATLAILAFLHFSGSYPLQRIFDQAGSLMTVAVIFADSLSLVLYLAAHKTGSTYRMLGNHVYDFFMGASLHPRIGILDIKMFAEIRISWFLLFILTVSGAAKEYEQTGAVSLPMYLLIIAHLLYANACAKGEHYVPPTWDITYEKFGWMLCFWNFAGVPFLYSKQSVYLALRLGSPLQSPYVMGFLLVVLLSAYYIWDTAQSQKNHFRLQFSGVDIKRSTFPQLPWRQLENPMFLTTAKGTPLLVDGWWAYARKIHYSADIVMSFCWAVTCGFTHLIPYLYVAFFLVMITHRYFRDVAKCSREYGADWKRYTAIVPYAFIPRVI